ncbi:glycoside hydrolase family 3 C-terminal domain-containing protein [Ruminococcus sp.]|uniref:glycoside hydrolase family 3 C-terminal domain-containing protein n=1 Tax=Ruminococcus sp. TaxID=41978 RepID=UPI002C191D52|nr:glycoside hydrolase family 3 C-terminal domain-containing protein [Ruminococcus sp.]HNZ99611.1 glycoside hydrolase family 3 C-terminal domain-containing protein [Ruminococcus sp.]HOH86629.1 glycoside hydrolase family 3 C-terminal domain-containing protein [Ruminococcus sp.]
MEKYMDEALSAIERAEDLTDRLSVQEMAEQLKYDAPAVERLGISAYNWWSEGLHGVARAGTATMFPQAIGMAAMFDEEAVRKAGEVTSTEARAKYNEYSAHDDRDIYKGLTLWSPNINIFRDPRWGRGQETYGEDPYLTTRLGVAYTKGLQGEGKVLRVAACAKHFAVHSGPEATRHEFDAKANMKDMTETYIAAFEALVKEAKVESVMGAYNRVNGEPACANTFLMNKLEEWGFDGHFVSDCWAIRDFHTNHGVTKTAPESAALALKKGCDLNCGNTYLHLLAAYGEKLITDKDLRKSCVKLMRTRIRLGMFDKSTEYDGLDYDIVSCDEHKKFALECSERSMVLLKNNGILPLDGSKYKTIGVIGPNADSVPALEGNYNGKADEYVTFLSGIREAFDGRVIYSEGCHLYKDRCMGLALPDDRLAEAEIITEHSDIVVLCVGLDATIEGEEGDTGNEFSSGDKNDLRLPESQRKLVKTVMAKGKPVIIVTAAGSAINVEADCDALIHAWYPGQFGGRALANILFGKISPSGKLPVTFYEDASKLPDFSDYSMKNRTYRYAEGNILYPFGFGLTYSETECSELSFADGKASVKITNTGSRAVEDVVQFYIKGNSENAVPNHSLCGFKRVALDAGESQVVQITLPERAFMAVNEKGEWVKEGKEFTLYAGTSQPDSLSKKLTGKECTSLKINA